MATTTTTTTASHNPFRTPAPTPQATGAPSPSYSQSQSAPTPHPSAAAAGSTRIDPTGLTDEAPPAYTPSADVYQGEETIEYGPRRPFQQAPPPPRAAFASPPGPVMAPSHPHAASPPLLPPPQGQGQGTSLWRQLTGQIAAQLVGPSSAAAQSWSAYPGRQEQAFTGGSARLRVPGPPQLPPRHPAASSPGLSTSPGGGTSPGSAPGPDSDFARDFYAAGPGVARDAPTSSAGYAPPPGPPPGGRGGEGGGGGAWGRPTDTPTPGHPLLRGGKLLVYPRGYECEKCHNFGYKHADPSHPCKKCWPKYAKPFQGPLVYAYSAGEAEPGEGATAFQRPLPDFRPPRHHAHSHGNNNTLSRSAPSSPTRPRHHHPPPPPAPIPIPIPPPPPPPQHPRNVHALSPYAAPPPGAVVYAAGDPRIGGVACWSCGGRGSVSFLVFDSVTCEVCAGVGRVF